MADQACGNLADGPRNDTWWTRKAVFSNGSRDTPPEETGSMFIPEGPPAGHSHGETDVDSDFGARPARGRSAGLAAAHCRARHMQPDGCSTQIQRQNMSRVSQLPHGAQHLHTRERLIGRLRSQAYQHQAYDTARASSNPQSSEVSQESEASLESDDSRSNIDNGWLQNSSAFVNSETRKRLISDPSGCFRHETEHSTRPNQHVRPGTNVSGSSPTMLMATGVPGGLHTATSRRKTLMRYRSPPYEGLGQSSRLLPPCVRFSEEASASNSSTSFAEGRKRCAQQATHAIQRSHSGGMRAAMEDPRRNWERSLRSFKAALRLSSPPTDEESIIEATTEEDTGERLRGADPYIGSRKEGPRVDEGCGTIQQSEEETAAVGYESDSAEERASPAAVPFLRRGLGMRLSRPTSACTLLRENANCRNDAHDHRLQEAMRPRRTRLQQPNRTKAAARYSEKGRWKEDSDASDSSPERRVSALDSHFQPRQRCRSSPTDSTSFTKDNGATRSRSLQVEERTSYTSTSGSLSAREKLSSPDYAQRGQSRHFAADYLGSALRERRARREAYMQSTRTKLVRGVRPKIKNKSGGIAHRREGLEREETVPEFGTGGLDNKESYVYRPEKPNGVPRKHRREDIHKEEEAGDSSDMLSMSEEGEDTVEPGGRMASTNKYLPIRSQRNPGGCSEGEEEYSLRTHPEITRADIHFSAHNQRDDGPSRSSDQSLLDGNLILHNLETGSLQQLMDGQQQPQEQPAEKDASIMKEIALLQVPPYLQDEIQNQQQLNYSCVGSEGSKESPDGQLPYIHRREAPNDITTEPLSPRFGTPEASGDDDADGNPESLSLAPDQDLSHENTIQTSACQSALYKSNSSTEFSQNSTPITTGLHGYDRSKREDDSKSSSDAWKENVSIGTRPTNNRSSDVSWEKTNGEDKILQQPAGVSILLDNVKCSGSPQCSSQDGTETESTLTTATPRGEGSVFASSPLSSSFISPADTGVDSSNRHGFDDFELPPGHHISKMRHSNTTTSEISTRNEDEEELDGAQKGRRISCVVTCKPVAATTARSVTPDDAVMASTEDDCAGATAVQGFSTIVEYAGEAPTLKISSTQMGKQPCYVSIEEQQENFERLRGACVAKFSEMQRSPLRSVSKEEIPSLPTAKNSSRNNNEESNTSFGLMGVAARTNHLNICAGDEESNIICSVRNAEKGHCTDDCSVLLNITEKKEISLTPPAKIISEEKNTEAKTHSDSCTVPSSSLPDEQEKKQFLQAAITDGDALSGSSVACQASTLPETVFTASIEGQQGAATAACGVSAAANGGTSLSADIAAARMKRLNEEEEVASTDNSTTSLQAADTGSHASEALATKDENNTTARSADEETLNYEKATDPGENSLGEAVTTAAPTSQPHEDSIGNCESSLPCSTEGINAVCSSLPAAPVSSETLKMPLLDRALLHLGHIMCGAEDTVTSKTAPTLTETTAPLPKKLPPVTEEVTANGIEAGVKCATQEVTPSSGEVIVAATRESSINELPSSPSVSSRESTLDAKAVQIYETAKALGASVLPSHHQQHSETKQQPCKIKPTTKSFSTSFQKNTTPKTTATNLPLLAIPPSVPKFNPRTRGIQPTVSDTSRTFVPAAPGTTETTVEMQNQQEQLFPVTLLSGPGRGGKGAKVPQTTRTTITGDTQKKQLPPQCNSPLLLLKREDMQKKVPYLDSLNLDTNMWTSAVSAAVSPLSISHATPPETVAHLQDSYASTTPPATQGVIAEATSTPQSLFLRALLTPRAFDLLDNNNLSTTGHQTTRSENTARTTRSGLSGLCSFETRSQPFGDSATKSVNASFPTLSATRSSHMRLNAAKPGGRSLTTDATRPSKDNHNCLGASVPLPLPPPTKRRCSAPATAEMRVTPAAIDAAALGPRHVAAKTSRPAVATHKRTFTNEALSSTACGGQTDALSAAIHRTSSPLFSAPKDDTGDSGEIVEAGKLEQRDNSKRGNSDQKHLSIAADHPSFGADASSASNLWNSAAAVAAAVAEETPLMRVLTDGKEGQGQQRQDKEVHTSVGAANICVNHMQAAESINIATKSSANCAGSSHIQSVTSSHPIRPPADDKVAENQLSAISPTDKQFGGKERLERSSHSTSTTPSSGRFVPAAKPPPVSKLPNMKKKGGTPSPTPAVKPDIQEDYLSIVPATVIITANETGAAMKDDALLCDGLNAGFSRSAPSPVLCTTTTTTTPNSNTTIRDKKSPANEERLKALSAIADYLKANDATKNKNQNVMATRVGALSSTFEGTPVSTSSHTVSVSKRTLKLVEQRESVTTDAAATLHIVSQRRFSSFIHPDEFNKSTGTSLIYAEQNRENLCCGSKKVTPNDAASSPHSSQSLPCMNISSEDDDNSKDKSHESITDKHSRESRRRSGCSSSGEKRSRVGADNDDEGVCPLQLPKKHHQQQQQEQQQDEQHHRSDEHEKLEMENNPGAPASSVSSLRSSSRSRKRDGTNRRKGSKERTVDYKNKRGHKVPSTEKTTHRSEKRSLEVNGEKNIYKDEQQKTTVHHNKADIDPPGTTTEINNEKKRTSCRDVQSDVTGPNEKKENSSSAIQVKNHKEANSPLQYSDGDDYSDTSSLSTERVGDSDLKQLRHLQRSGSDSEEHLNQKKLPEALMSHIQRLHDELEHLVRKHGALLLREEHYLRVQEEQRTALMHARLKILALRAQQPSWMGGLVRATDAFSISDDPHNNSSSSSRKKTEETKDENLQQLEKQIAALRNSVHSKQLLFQATNERLTAANNSLRSANAKLWRQLRDDQEKKEILHKSTFFETLSMQAEDMAAEAQRKNEKLQRSSRENRLLRSKLGDLLQLMGPLKEALRSARSESARHLRALAAATASKKQQQQQRMMMMMITRGCQTDTFDINNSDRETARGSTPKNMEIKKDGRTRAEGIGMGVQTDEFSPVNHNGEEGELQWAREKAIHQYLLRQLCQEHQRQARSWMRQREDLQQRVRALQEGSSRRRLSDEHQNVMRNGNRVDTPQSRSVARDAVPTSIKSKEDRCIDRGAGDAAENTGIIRTPAAAAAAAAPVEPFFESSLLSSAAAEKGRTSNEGGGHCETMTTAASSVDDGSVYFPVSSSNVVSSSICNEAGHDDRYPDYSGGDELSDYVADLLNAEEKGYWTLGDAAPPTSVFESEDAPDRLTSFAQTPQYTQKQRDNSTSDTLRNVNSCPKTPSRISNNTTTNSSSNVTSGGGPLLSSCTADDDARRDLDDCNSRLPHLENRASTATDNTTTTMPLTGGLSVGEGISAEVKNLIATRATKEICSPTAAYFDRGSIIRDNKGAINVQEPARRSSTTSIPYSSGAAGLSLRLMPNSLQEVRSASNARPLYSEDAVAGVLRTTSHDLAKELRREGSTYPLLASGSLPEQKYYLSSPLRERVSTPQQGRREKCYVDLECARLGEFSGSQLAAGAVQRSLAGNITLDTIPGFASDKSNARKRVQELRRQLREQGILS